MEVIRQHIDGHAKQKETARRLGLSTRQVRNLAKTYRQSGAAGLIHGNRSRVINRKIRDKVRQSALALVRERYWDFGPTFAHEKLVEDHGFSFSVESLRQWLIALRCEVSGQSESNTGKIVPLSPDRSH